MFSSAASSFLRHKEWGPCCSPVGVDSCSQIHPLCLIPPSSEPALPFHNLISFLASPFHCATAAAAAVPVADRQPRPR